MIIFLWCLGLDLTKPDIDVFVAGSLLSTRKISLNDVIITVMREFRTGVVLFKVCLMPLPLKSCNCPQPLLNPAIDTDTAVKLSLHKNELYFPYLIPFLPSFEIWLNKKVVSDHIGQKCNFFALFMWNFALLSCFTSMRSVKSYALSTLQKPTKMPPISLPITFMPSLCD